MKTYTITYSVANKDSLRLITKKVQGTSTIDAITKYFDNCPDYMIKRFELVGIIETEN